MHRFALIEFHTREARRDSDGVMLLFDSEEAASEQATELERRGIRIVVCSVTVDGERVLEFPRPDHIWKLVK